MKEEKMKKKLLRRRKVLLIAVLIVAMVTMMAACGEKSGDESSSTGDSNNTAENGESQPSDSTGSASFDGEIIWGEDDSLTGSGAGSGLPSHQGTVLAVEQINAEGGITVDGKHYEIKLISYDNKSDASEAVATINKLMDVDKVHFILGWGSSTATLAAAQIAMTRPDDVTMVVGNGRTPMLMVYNTQGNIFRSGTGNVYDPIGIVQYMADIGITKMGVIAMMNDTAYSVSTEQYMGRMPDVGIEPVGPESFEADDQDFNTQVTKLLNEDVNGILTVGNIVESATIVRTVREQGSDIPIVNFSVGTGSQWLGVCTNEQMKDTYGVRPWASAIGSTDDGTQEAYTEAYEQRWGDSPAQADCQAYDDVFILKAAYEKANSLDPLEVREAMKNLTVSDLDPRHVDAFEPLEGDKLFDEFNQAYAPYQCLKWSEELQDWKFEAVVGRDLGPKAHRDYVLDARKKEGL
jgi:branched-chain amino acid transport system substrate-binding protein